MNQVHTIAPLSAFWMAPDALVSIYMETDAIIFLQKQVERDIEGKYLGWRPIPFTLDELKQIEKVLPHEISNCVMTNSRRRLLAQYCAHYMAKALSIGDYRLSGLYDELLDQLLDNATYITFLL